MALADDLKEDIAAVLDDPDFGRDVTLTQLTPGAYTSSSGASAAATTTNYSTRGLILGYRDHLVDGTLIKQGDRKGILKAKDLTTVPAVGDKLTVGSVIYTIEHVKPNELGGTDFVYIVQLRK